MFHFSFPNCFPKFFFCSTDKLVGKFIKVLPLIRSDDDGNIIVSVAPAAVHIFVHILVFVSCCVTVCCMYVCIYECVCNLKVQLTTTFPISLLNMLATKSNWTERFYLLRVDSTKLTQCNAMLKNCTSFIIKWHML